MIGQHQAAILATLAEGEASATEAPTMEELIEAVAAVTERAPSAVRESVMGLQHGASIERVPDDRRKDWDEARVQMSEMGRGDLARFMAARE